MFTLQFSLQPIQNKENAQCTNISIHQVESIASEQNQTRTPHVQQVQTSHNPTSGSGLPVYQSAHLVNQTPYLTNHLGIEDLASWPEQFSTSRTHPSLVKLLRQQQALQRDTTAVFLSFQTYRLSMKMRIS